MFKQNLLILLMVIFLLIDSDKIYPQGKMKIEIIYFGQIENFVGDYLTKNLGEIFKAQVYFGKSQNVPEYAYNKQRKQYYSSAILDNISKPKNNEQKILAVIDKDLYVPELNFVFGEAAPAKGVCIIELARLHQSFYGLPEDKDLFLKRTLKEAVHEIGHLLGLGHCPDTKCVMHFSNSLLDTDKKDYNFCANCKKLVP